MNINVKNYYQSVRDFNEKINPTSQLLRSRLIQEEFDEVCVELRPTKIDKKKLAKELCDLIYVVMGGFYDVYGNKMNPLVHTGFAVSLNNSVLTSLLQDNISDFASQKTYKSINLMSYYTFCLVVKYFDIEVFERCFAEVHRANMHKLENVQYDETGKVMKAEKTVKSRANLDFLDAVKVETKIKEETND